MKSRTSFFNPTVLKKDITRFAPVWGLYIVFLFILFLGTRFHDPAITANNTSAMLNTITVVNLIYGGLCANILFGDLFQSRMCYGLHAMHLRRETWFLTHVFAGILFCIVPNIFGTLLYMILLQQYWYMALLYLAVSILGFLFFFGLGTFSVMCAGNRLGMSAVYLIINFFSVLVYVLMKGIYEPLLYGLEFLSDPFLFFCPVYFLSDSTFLSFRYDYVADRYVNGRIDTLYPEIWWYLVVVAVMGIGLMLLAVCLYRKRNLECAGDFLSIKALEPVFLIIYTMAFSVFFYSLTSLFGLALHSTYISMGIGAAVGFFTGQMFLKRTVQVFQKKSFLRFGIFAAVLILSLVLTKIDPLRITWRMPDAEEVSYVQIYLDRDQHLYGGNYRMESPQEIAASREIHAKLMSERGEKTDGVSRVYVHYTLKSGREVIRYYLIDEHTAAYDTLKMYFSDYRYLFHCESWEQIAGMFTELTVNLYEDYLKTGDDSEAEYVMPKAEELSAMDIEGQEKIRQFMEALRKDCVAGNMAQGYTFHVGENSVAWCYLSSILRTEENIIISNGERFQELTIYPSATHTLAVLEQWMTEPEN